jgi:2-keto-4-pentenoate hydratase/2-oxohepta-3-ene-1,7-dioic acid hydratase in catechol pathway
MKLARYTHQGATKLGSVVGDRIVPIDSLVSGAPATMRALLAAGAGLRQRLAQALPSAAQGIPLTDVRLEAPLTDPQKFLAIGMNFRAHAAESAAAGYAVPKSQLWFNKQVSCIAGPFDPVHLPKVSDKLDYEAELGFVIGQRCRHVSEADARRVVAGYFVANDVSVRDWQHRSPTYTLGKSFDTHGPIGPWITTDDEIPDPHRLLMRLTVNGEERQKSLSDDMIYNIWQQISYLSTVMTLEPGDLILTGTPSGVGIASGRYLKVGDVVRVEIEGLGHIENCVIAEP